MRIDGARADDEGFSDLGIGEPSCHQPQHLHFTFGQLVRIGWGRTLGMVRPGERAYALIGSPQR